MKFGKIFFLLFFGIFELQLVSQEQDLPVLIKDAQTNANPMVFYISGDGGWNNYDKKLAQEFEDNHMPYIALNSFRYFWSRKTPDELTKDVVPLIKKYLKVWQKSEIILVGYSFGAEVMPFLVNRLPADIKEKVKLITLITPGSTSDFTIHINDMLLLDGTYDYKVVPEINKITVPTILCFFGDDEVSIFPKTHQQKNLKTIKVKGGHVFSDSKIVMHSILTELNSK